MLGTLTVFALFGASYYFIGRKQEDAIAQIAITLLSVIGFMMLISFGAMVDMMLFM